MISPLVFVVISIVAGVSNADDSGTRGLLKGYFWEVKPFIFTNDKGEIDGIIPHTFKRADAFCSKKAGLAANVKVIDFVKRYDSREQFYKQVHDVIPYGKGDFKNVSKGEVFFAPILDEMDSDWESKNDFRSFVLMKTEEIAIIVPRSMIDLPNKILLGIASCKIVFFIAIPLAVLVSIIIWVIERTWNPEIERSFIRGTGTTFWWSIVSMTTVGYGDVTPKAPLGRFLAVSWLVVGVMLGCVITATMTDVVSGIGNLSVYGEEVAVLKDSYEEKVASRDYQAKVVPAKSYEDVLELVRAEKVYAAMMNADVAAWYQDKIKASDGTHPPLHIINKMPANLYVKCLMNNVPSQELIDVIRCMYGNKEEIYDYPQERFQRYCHTETLHIGTIEEMFKRNRVIQILIALVVVLVAVGLFYDLLTLYKDSNKHCSSFRPASLWDRLLGKQNSTPSAASSVEEHRLVEKPNV